MRKRNEVEGISAEAAAAADHQYQGRLQLRRILDSRQVTISPYVRVLEMPTPRWTMYDAKNFGVKLPEDVSASIQERAYTSPMRNLRVSSTTSCARRSRTAAAGWDDAGGTAPADESVIGRRGFTGHVAGGLDLSRARRRAHSAGDRLPAVRPRPAAARRPSLDPAQDHYRLHRSAQPDARPVHVCHHPRP